MKNIIIFTMGTRGDIEPYIYLARALIRHGNKVTIGTHPYWKNLITNMGIYFTPIGPDVDIEIEAAKIRGKNKSSIFSMLNTMKFIFNIIENSSDQIYENCKDKDLVIVSHSNMGAVEADILNIKTVNVTLQTDFIKDPVKSKKLISKSIGSIINYITVKPYNKIRKKYNLSKFKNLDQIMSKSLNLIPISSYVIKPNPLWEKKNKVIGYWYENNNDFTPDSNLKEFLKSGEKPIIIALGAMSFEDVEEKEKLNIFINAITKTNMRGIIQGFNKSLENYNLPENIIAVKSIPHSWLFKQGYCVIHHGGFGTSASSMIFNIPSIVIPHALDQFSMANTLYELKVSVKPIKSSQLSEESLVNAILEMKNNYNILTNNVNEISRKITNENGCEKAVTLINEVLL